MKADTLCGSPTCLPLMSAALSEVMHKPHTLCTLFNPFPRRFLICETAQSHVHVCVALGHASLELGVQRDGGRSAAHGHEAAACAPAAERVAAVVDRVLSLDYATVSPEVQPAQQPESAPHSAYQSDPMHHPDAGPVLNGLYEQACPTRRCAFPYLQVTL